MKTGYKKAALFLFFGLAVFLILYLLTSFFFDQAVLVRKGTFYQAHVSDKVVALTFDDGPSPKWTPRILDELKRARVKATFFMIGKHVQMYPDIARRIVSEGHEIGNHSFNHPVLYFSDHRELENEILQTERIIKDTTGITTRLFRPPKAWLTEQEKRKINELGYGIVLWTLNSKDWVTFDDKYIVRYLLKHIQPGDIILFHDSGGFLSIEGGDRKETVKAIPRLIEKLKERGYRFLTVSELLKLNDDK